jgi:hypothetical protein
MLQGPLYGAATPHPAAQIVLYFDDINVVGLVAAAAPAFEALAMEVRTPGLALMPPRSAAYSPDHNMAAAAAAELGVLHARDALVVAGTSMGIDQFIHNVIA